MLRWLCLLLMFLTLFICGSSLLAQINPVTQIDWVPITGSGDPATACSASNYGQPYQNTAVHKIINSEVWENSTWLPQHLR